MPFQKGNKINLGRRLSETQKKKWSEVKKGHIGLNKGVPLTEKIKKKISESLKGRSPWNKGKKGYPSSRKGVRLSEETKDKISNSLKGRYFSETHRLRLSKAGKGREFTEAHKLNLSTSLKGKHAWNKGISPSLEVREKISKSLLGNMIGDRHPNFGKKLTDEVKNKISIAHQGKKGMSGEANPMYGRRGDKAVAWRGGVSFIPYCPKFNKSLKNKIRERDQHSCQLCGCKENGKKLDIHHVHYDKPNCDPDLITLCRICHAKVNFNRAYYENLFIDNLKQRGLLCNQNVKSSQSNSDKML